MPAQSRSAPRSAPVKNADQPSAAKKNSASVMGEFYVTGGQPVVPVVGENTPLLMGPSAGPLRKLLQHGFADSANPYMSVRDQVGPDHASAVIAGERTGEKEDGADQDTPAY